MDGLALFSLFVIIIVLWTYTFLLTRLNTVFIVSPNQTSAVVGSPTLAGFPSAC
jgi:hypothetical protein